MMGENKATGGTCLLPQTNTSTKTKKFCLDFSRRWCTMPKESRNEKYILMLRPFKNQTSVRLCQRLTIPFMGGFDYFNPQLDEAVFLQDLWGPPLFVYLFLAPGKACYTLICTVVCT